MSIKRYYSNYTGKQIDEAVSAIVDNSVKLEDLTDEVKNYFALAGHLHDYLPLTGGMVNGSVQAQGYELRGPELERYYQIKVQDNTSNLLLDYDFNINILKHNEFKDEVNILNINKDNGTLTFSEPSIGQYLTIEGAYNGDEANIHSTNNKDLWIGRDDGDSPYLKFTSDFLEVDKETQFNLPLDVPEIYFMETGREIGRISAFEGIVQFNADSQFEFLSKTDGRFMYMSDGQISLFNDGIRFTISNDAYMPEAFIFYGDNYGFDNEDGNPLIWFANGKDIYIHNYLNITPEDNKIIMKLPSTEGTEFIIQDEQGARKSTYNFNEGVHRSSWDEVFNNNVSFNYDTHTYIEDDYNHTYSSETNAYGQISWVENKEQKFSIEHDATGIQFENEIGDYCRFTHNQIEDEYALVSNKFGLLTPDDEALLYTNNNELYFGATNKEYATAFVDIENKELYVDSIPVKENINKFNHMLNTRTYQVDIASASWVKIAKVTNEDRCASGVFTINYRDSYTDLLNSVIVGVTISGVSGAKLLANVETISCSNSLTWQSSGSSLVTMTSADVGTFAIRFSDEETGVYVEALITSTALAENYRTVIVDLRIDNNTGFEFLENLTTSTEYTGENVLIEGGTIAASPYLFRWSCNNKELREYLQKYRNKNILQINTSTHKWQLSLKDGDHIELPGASLPNWLLINYRDQETITVDEEVKVRIPNYDNISSYINKDVKLDLPKGIKSLLLKKGTPLTWRILHTDGEFKDVNNNFYVNGVNIGSESVEKDVWISQNDEFTVGFALYPNNNYDGPDCVFQLGYEYDIDEAILYNEETVRFRLLTSEEEPHTILYQDKNCPIHFELIPTSIKTSGTILRTNTTIENEVRGLQDSLNGPWGYLRVDKLGLYNYTLDDGASIECYDNVTNIKFPSMTAFRIDDGETSYIRTYKYEEGDYDIEFGSPVWYSDPQITMHINPHNYSETYMEINGAKVATQNDINVLNAKFEQLPVLEKEVDSTKAVVNVPNDALDYCLIDEIGGMSYESENLIILDDKGETALGNGVTYSIKDGVITLNGEATSDYAVQIKLKNPMPIGTYTLKTFGDRTISRDVMLIANHTGWEQVIQFAPITQSSITKTTTEVGEYFRYDILNTPKTYNNYKIIPMLVKGSVVPTEFKQGYSGFRNAKVESVSFEQKNFIIDDYNRHNQTSGAYTISRDKDGWFTLSKDNSSASSISFFQNKTNPLPVGTYSFRIVFKDNKPVNLGTFKIIYDTSNDKDIVSSTNYTGGYNISNFYANYPIERVYCYISSSVVLDNVQFKVELVKGSFMDDRLQIPTSVQELDGYGLGVDQDNYNYIWYDEENNKYYYTQNVASYTFTGSENIVESETVNNTEIKRYYWRGIQNSMYPTTSSSSKGFAKFPQLERKTADDIYHRKEGVAVGTSGSVFFYISTIQTVADMQNYLKGKTLIYKLANPIITDISNIITEELYLEIQNQGTITFNNDYNLDIPNKITYAIKAF